MNNYIKFLNFFILLLVFSSCKKLVSIAPPKTQLTPVQAFVDDQSAVAVISNIYSQFNSMIDGNLTPLLSLYTDDLTTTSTQPQNLEYSNGMVSVSNSSNLNMWKFLYSVVYQCNALLENIKISQGLTPSIKQQLTGETYFLRSVGYFYLTNIYGDVPLLLSTDVNITSTSARDSSAKVYSQIINDLLEAKTMLAESYPSDGKVRANKWAAIAFLSRVYLYQKKWKMAESESSLIIFSGNYRLLDNLNGVFLKNSPESILQFWTRQGFTVEGPLFIPFSGSLTTYPISNNLVNSFQINDKRRENWIDSQIWNSETYYYAYKYKNRSSIMGENEEYLSFLRLSEQYLIRAEARAEQNDFIDALKDLNAIRNRAGLLDLISDDKGIILMEIAKERRLELFCEWGHRFFDLKRYGILNQLMPSIKPAWKDGSALLPIPQYERLNNPNLTQNPGY